MKLLRVVFFIKLIVIYHACVWFSLYYHCRLAVVAGGASSPSVVRGMQWRPSRIKYVRQGGIKYQFVNCQTIGE